MSGPRSPDAPGRYIPFHLRELIVSRSGYACFYCGIGPPLTIDHIVPWSQGGTHHPLNLVAACTVCNSIAGERLFRDITDKLAYITTRRTELAYAGHDLLALADVPGAGGLE